MAKSKINENSLNEPLTNRKRKPIAHLVNSAIPKKTTKGKDVDAIIALTLVDNEKLTRIQQAWSTGKIDEILTEDDHKAIEVYNKTYSILCEYDNNINLAVNALMVCNNISRTTAYKHIRDTQFLFGSTFGFDKNYKKMVFINQLEEKLLESTGRDYAAIAKIYNEVMGFNDIDDDLPNFEKLREKRTTIIEFNPKNLGIDYNEDAIKKDIQNILKKLNEKENFLTEEAEIIE